MNSKRLSDIATRGETSSVRPIRIRFAIIFFFLITAVTILPLLGLRHILPVVFEVILLGLFANILSFLWLRSGRAIKYRIYFATSVDFLLITIAIHYLGGIETTMAWIYAVALIAIASLNGVRIGVFAAVVSSLMYSALLVGEYKGLIPHVDFNHLNSAYLHEDSSYLIIKLLTDNILFLVSATVSGLLSERLIHSRDESERRNLEILEMQEILKQNMGNLEKTVSERTRELTETNEHLRKEISDRELAEIGLRNSQERLRILFEFAPDAYYLHDFRGAFIDANKAAEELVGFTRDEMIGKSFLELDMVSEDQLERAVSVLNESRDGKATGPEEFLLKRKDGGRVSVEIRTFPVTIGGQTLVLGLARDVTERRRMEQELRLSEARYRGIYDTAPLAFVAWDRECRITDWNRRAESLLGWSREEALNEHFHSLLFPHWKKSRIETVVNEALRGTLARYTVAECMTKSGEMIICEWNNSLQYDSDGNVTGIVSVALDITERQRAEEELRASEERYRTLLDTVEIGFYETDLAGNFVFFNDTVVKTLGYSREELAGLNFRRYVSDEDAKAMFQAFNAVFKTGRADKSFECDIVTKDGSVKHMEYGVSLVRDRDGHPIGFRGLVRDVSERRHAAEAIEESYSLLRATLEATDDGLLVVNAEGKITSFNQKFVELWRIPDSVLDSRDDDEALAFVLNQLKDPDEFLRKVKELYSKPEAESSDILEFIDGRIFERYSRPQRVGGRAVGRVWSFRDVTERRRAAEKVRKSEERYRRLFEETRDVILITTPEGKFIDINPAGVEFYGFLSKTELLENLDARDTYVEPKDREEFQRIIAEQGFVKDHELKLRNRDGHERDALVTANAVKDEAGNIVAYRGILRDVTHQRQLERQFLQAQKMESIGTLAGGIAHDFNNILGGILGYASLMKSKITDDHRFFKYVDTIERGSIRAAELTDQLLAFARGGKYNTRAVDLNEVIRETLGIIGRTFDKSIEIDIRLDEDLPAVEADEGQMQQALMNLCVNASDAMPDGGRLEIASRTEILSEEDAKSYVGASPGPHVVVSVADTGCGMSKETMLRIFEPFFTTKAEGKGTGLGLSMIYGVVKNHGGFVTVDSEEGKGSIFRIYMPSSEKPTLPPVAEAEVPRGGCELILVVDDEEPIRSFAKEVLETHGYSVLSAADGSEAVEIFRNNNGDISLVILDMMMPKMGGQEAFQKLIELKPDVRAVLSTGYSQKGKAQDILNSGVKGFIQKPYKVNALLSKVRSILDEEIQN